MSANGSPSVGLWPTITTSASRLAREPLAQFFAVALVLFSANSLIHGPDTGAPATAVVISQGRVLQIADSYRLLAGRSPSRAELQALVDDFIEEEIYYREAVAMGLDTDDTIVRRRMRQKLGFIIEDADASEEPSDDQLAVWLSSHAADYRLPERISFRHVLASSDTRGANAPTDAAAFLDALISGADPEDLGDASMLPSALPLTTRHSVAALFGDGFASRVFQHTDDTWFGPVTSPFGAHDVLVMSREPARNPTLNEARDTLRSDWIEARRIAKREEFQSRLRQRYDVSIDWPEPYASPPGSTDNPRGE